MSNDEPRPGTSASIERRVERIENQLAVQEKTITVVQLEQIHLKELMSSEFRSASKGQEAVVAKLDALSIQLTEGQVKAATAMGDPMETPAGRAIMAAVTDVVGRTAGIERKVYMAAGAFGLVTFLGPIVARVVFP